MILRHRTCSLARLTFGLGCLVFYLFLFAGFSLAGGEELRTWTDVTGKHKIKAAFISLEDGKVSLEKPDGSTIEIELAKLSKADQKYVNEATKSADDDPFQTKEKSPFETKPSVNKTGRTKKEPAAKSPTYEGSSGEPRTIAVDYSGAETISLATTDKWEVDVAAPSESFASKPKTAPLPKKTNFFEGIKGIAVNRAAGKAAVGFALDDPKPEGTTRVVICDLATGKTSGAASAATKMAPLALHDDGKQIVMRRDEFGFGNQDRLEVWTLSGPRVQRTAVWTPGADVQGAGRDVLWGEFLDSTHLATSSREGKVVIWSFPQLEPLTTFTLGDGAVPGLSPDRKRIAYCTGKEIGIYDVVRGEVIAQQPTPEGLQWPSVAFSPSGKKLACLAFDKLLQWDTATGALERTIPLTGIHVQGPIDYTDDNFVLVSDKFLIDLENQLKLWSYDVPHGGTILSAGGWTFFALSDGEQKPGALVAAQIPHPAARSLLKKALTQPDLFVLHSGTTVKLNVNGIPDPGQRDQIQRTLVSRLQTIGCQAGDNGTIELAASMEGPKDRDVKYMFGGGDYKVKEYMARLKFVYQGQTAWETSGSNVPGVISLKQGENVADKLRAAEKPDYGFFERVVLPKFLQKPAQGKGPGNSVTLGQSNITTSGIQ
ncbi:MAG TPA: SHD1 domain-containing protein [Pirellulales bacterium]|nr:SHD1 domain-containing protein [Pirellulales bacterium]